MGHHTGILRGFLLHLNRRSTGIPDSMSASVPMLTSTWRSSIAVLRAHRLIVAGAAMILSLVLAALAAPLLTRAGALPTPAQQHPHGLDGDGMPLGPGGFFRLGTDNLGRDVLARVIHGTRISLPIAFGAMVTATCIGTLVGLLAGFHGGRLDATLMRLTEVNLTIPAILLAVAFAGLLDGRVVRLHPAALDWPLLDFRMQRGPLSLFLIIGLVCWPGMVRVVRAQVLQLKEREFVAASRALGATDARLVFRHILPNLLPSIIVLAVMSTGNMILLEAGLGYLGIGVPPPTPTWGSMISDGQPYFVSSPHIVVVPGLAITWTVLAFNLLGQGLQEALASRRDA